MFTLDTNVLIYYAHGDTSVSDFIIKELEQETAFFISTIVIIEFLSFPALKLKERTFFHDLLSQLHSVPVDIAIARIAANVRKKHNLRLGDSVIAATALHTHSTLLTRNVSDFKKVAHLKLLPL